MARMTGWQAVVEALRVEGVKRVYGLPGDAGHLYDALSEAPEIVPIQNRHEVSGVFMAMTEARLTNQVGVCHGSPGPGMANMVPGILEAYSACMPVVCLVTGAPQRFDGMGAFQENDAVGIARPITKWAVRVERTDRVPWTMRRAFHLARSGKPGPVLVELPGDIALAEAEMEPYTPAPRGLRAAADPALLARAATMIRTAKRPILVAGGGVMLSRAGGELLRLAEQEHIPVMTTFSGRGSISEANPLAFGLVGLYRTRPGKDVYDGADLLITVGARMEGFQSGDWNIFPTNARFLQIDLDADEIGRNWPPDAAVIGDAALVLDALGDALAQDPGARDERAAYAEGAIAARAAFARQVDAECAAATGGPPLKSKRIVHELNEVFGKDTILVNENGGQDLWSYFHPYYRVLDAGDLVPMAEQTCMGAGVIGAIAAKIVCPHKKVVCVAGDGAFQMMPQELSTAVQYGAAVTWVVLNNRGLGWAKLGQMRSGRPALACDFEAQPDFVALAEAHGVHAERVDRAQDIAPALRRALKANQLGSPAMVEFPVDATEYYVGFLNFPNQEWEENPVVMPVH